jgi:bleomycin hydrolase
LDEEFGILPKKFSVGNRLFTPTIYRDYLGINTSDYITLTSFMHHPFHQDIILEIPDNFANGTMYNVPIDEMMRALNYSVQQGYTATWDADVSNEGFSAQNGLAILPAIKWAEKTNKEQATAFQSSERELPVSQEYRQELFDQQVTMDDHLMHIVGIDSEVSNVGIFYLVKNSWGTISDAKGYIRASEAYLRLNTISITVNKKALPLDLQQRLGVAEGEPAIQHSVPAVREETPKPAAPTKQPGKVMKMTPVAKKAAPGYDN